MGKKAKTGKQRLDKYYKLAKEAGFRSRAAFKLIQLNKRFEFLQRSRTLVDLCAAPGGWLQVAAENMPVSSIRIGVDLVPIKPVKNCITLKGDITVEKTRHAIKNEFHDWEVDCVLHDGAPNVAGVWSHDAFDQNCLTLSALKLATQVLKEHGWFVTKIFRSADYAALIQTFEKLFKKVHVWKPAASRLESAEIFVVCENYLKPKKVDPDLLNIKTVFKQIENVQPDVNIQRLISGKGKQKKVKALGYDDDNLSMFKELKASEFIASDDCIQLLAKANCMILDEERFETNKYTTDEFRAIIKDIRVAGGGELRKLLTWRKKIIEADRKEKHAEAKKVAEELPVDSEAEEEKELEEIDELIRNASAAEKSKLKKKRRLMLKSKRQLQERKQLGMVHENDRIDENLDNELFNLESIRNKMKLSALRSKTIFYNGDDFEEKPIESIEAIDGSAFGSGKEFDVKLSDDEIDDGDQRAAKRNQPEPELGEVDVEEEKPEEKKVKKVKLTPVMLAMGEKLIYSSKTRSEMEDWAWNRYTNNDTGLPDWFVEDEQKHCKVRPPISRERINFYKERDRALNARPIKAVVEAKMRKKKRQMRRLERAKKTAEGMIDNEQMGQSEKIHEVKKIYRKALKPEKREIKYVKMTKGKRGRVPRPTGGRYKVVDSRMKKDLRAEKRHNAAKGAKRGSKGPPPTKRPTRK